MKIDLDDFRRHFELLSDEALLATNRDDLVGSAQLCFDEEVERRQLNHIEAAPETETLAAAPADPRDELVSIADSVPPEEMVMARGLLASAGIPCMITNEYVGLGGFQMDLKVPASMVEHALEVLCGEISEEELAAQAEAAGAPEPEEEEF